MLPLCIALSVAALDQLTKYLIRSNFGLHQNLTVVSGIFDLRYIRNTGAAWGIFPEGTLWLSLLSVVMLTAIVASRKQLMSNSLFDRIGLGLICGGIIGNLIDRVVLRYVVDFLDFYWAGHHFPAFNVADSAITVGVFLYIVNQFLAGRREKTADCAEGAC